MTNATNNPEMNRLDGFRRLDQLEAKILQLQIDTLKKSSEDHEARLRTLEETATRFNFLLYLTMGGGLVSLLNLLGMAYLILSAGK